MVDFSPAAGYSISTWQSSFLESDEPDPVTTPDRVFLLRREWWDLRMRSLRPDAEARAVLMSEKDSDDG